MSAAQPRERALRSRGMPRAALLLLAAAAVCPADDLAIYLERERRQIDTLARASESVVCIFADLAMEGGGSGVLIDPRGYGVTNFHVVQEFVGTRRGYGGLNDGNLYRLRVIGIDPGGDVALFQLEGRDDFPVAPLGDSDSLAVGQPVAAIGNPFVLAEDFHPTVTLGVISGLHRYQGGQDNMLEYADCIQFSSSINPGNSGGPLFDLDGFVVGINGRASFEERGRVNVGIGYAISINQVRRFLPGLHAGRMVAHGTLGVQVQDAFDGVVVRAIQDRSPADRAGVRLGDRLVRLAGRDLRTANDYNNAINTFPADWPVALDLLRRDEALTLTARLERLELGAPLVFVPDFDHNRSAAFDILDRARSGLAPGAFAASQSWSGRAAPIEADDATEREVTARPPTWPDAAALGRLDASSDRVGDEWALAVGVLAPENDWTRDWEFVGGDERDGRIAAVLRFRPSGPTRPRADEINWWFDWERGGLLACEIMLGDGAAPIIWRIDRAERSAAPAPDHPLSAAWIRESGERRTLFEWTPSHAPPATQAAEDES